MRQSRYDTRPIRASDDSGKLGTSSTKNGRRVKKGPCRSSKQPRPDDQKGEQGANIPADRLLLLADAIRKKDDPSHVQLLLNEGYMLSDDQLSYLLRVAIAQGTGGNARLLLERGARIPADKCLQSTLLAAAFKRRDLAICQLLLDHGASFQIDSLSPLYLEATSNNRNKFARLLREHGTRYLQPPRSPEQGAEI